MAGGLLATSAVWVVGFLIPSWITFCAVAGKNTPLDTTQLTTYWIVYGLAFALEDLLSPVLWLVPMWPYLKLAFYLWLWTPYTDGAGLLYSQYLKFFLLDALPILEKHMRQLPPQLAFLGFEDPLPEQKEAPKETPKEEEAPKKEEATPKKEEAAPKATEPVPESKAEEAAKEEEPSEE